MNRRCFQGLADVRKTLRLSNNFHVCNKRKIPQFIVTQATPIFAARRCEKPVRYTN